MNIKLNEYLDKLIENIYPKHKLEMLRDAFSAFTGANCYVR